MCPTEQDHSGALASDVEAVGQRGDWHWFEWNTVVYVGRVDAYMDAHYPARHEIAERLRAYARETMGLMLAA
jgi:hypothetical protein